MQFSINIFTRFILVAVFFGGIFLVFAPPSIASSAGKHQSYNSMAEYPNTLSEPSIELRWPRGSLIFPENNDPGKTSEVFLLDEAFTSETALQSLHHHFGLQFLSRRKYNEAKVEYLKVLEFKPDIPAVHNDLGFIYFNSKNYRSAERAYRKALQLDPGYTTALAKLALTLAAQKKYTSAERKFRQAIRAEPSNADHYLNLGHFYYYLKKNYKRARNSYQKALKLNPRLIIAKNNLRDIDRKFRKWKDQENNFESSWGSDYDYDGPNNAGNPPNTPNYPEEADIAGTWDEENAQHPLF